MGRMNYLCKSILIFFISLCFVNCTTVPTPEPDIVGFSIFPPLQYPGRGTAINANRTSLLLGRHDKVSGTDFSMFGNITDKEFNGAALALGFNKTKGKAHIYGLQMALANLNYGTTHVGGLQIGGLLNLSKAAHNVYGLQLAGLANIGKKNTVYGAQVGLYNQAESIYGFQIGLFNKTKNLYGIQIGAINISSNNGLPFCPVVNAGF